MGALYDLSEPYDDFKWGNYMLEVSYVFLKLSFLNENTHIFNKVCFNMISMYIDILSTCECTNSMHLSI